MFYPRHQILTRFAIFYCAAPLSGAFGGLLATGFSQIVVQGYTRKLTCHYQIMKRLRIL